MADEQPFACADPFVSDSPAAVQFGPPQNARAGRPPRLLTKDALRPFAQRCDADQSQPFHISVLWRKLSDGTWKFVDTFSNQARCYAILSEQDTPRPPDPRLAALLSLAMSGQSRKVLAFDMNLSLSTISSGIQGCLRCIGLECRHAPALLIMAACNTRHSEQTAPRCRLSRLELGGRRWIVVSAPRPDLEFPAHLSDAEATVVRELVGGLSYAAIAEKRSRSVRTIANQVAAAFRKLGVSGRQALVERLIYNQVKGSVSS